MSWEEAGAGESQAKKEWREAILCPWLTTETTQLATRPPVWHLGIMALLSPIYQTKAFSALQHTAFCRPRWYPQRKGWLKPPALEDSAIQAGSQPAAVGFAPGNALLFVFYFELGPHFTLITHVSFFGFSSFWCVVICLSFCALFIRLVCCSVTCSPGVGGKGTCMSSVCEEHYRCWNCSNTSANLHSLTPVCFACPGLWAGGRQMLLVCTHKWLSSPTLKLVTGRLKHVKQTPGSVKTCWTVSSVVEGLFAKQQVYKQKEHQSALIVLINSNYQSWVSALAFMPGHATSSHSYTGMEGYFKHIKRQKP